MSLIKTISDTDYTQDVILIYKLLREKYGYTLRISMILSIIKDIFLGKPSEDFDLIDARTCNNGIIESYLIDRQIDWQNNKEVNFSEMFEKLKAFYNFSRTERLLLEDNKIEEKLWALYLALSKPSLE